MEIKISKAFKDYLESLNINKKAIINSKISYIKYTGFLGSTKTLGNNNFILNIEDIKKDLYFILNNNEILFINNKEDNKDIKEDWLEYNISLLKDINYIKQYYNRIYIIFKQTDQEEFFFNELKNISKTVNNEDFKKITGFDIDLIHNMDNIKITTLNQLKDKINFIIKIKSIDYIVKKTKVNKEDIEKILNIKQDINLKLLNDLIKL